jgi:hypothetical protein
MKLKYKIEKLEDVAEDQRSLYVQHGNAFVLDAEGAADAADVEHLNNRLVHMETEQKEQAAEFDKATATYLQERKGLEARIAELEKNRGTGATGGNGTPPVQETNPFKKETFNLTKQAAITKKDPARAVKLQQAAQA